MTSSQRNKARLAAGFYAQDTLALARALLGKRLVRRLAGLRLAGRIVEVEAYNGQDDLASHARVGCTARNQVMFGPAGHAYVYFTYGMHWLFNIVSGCPGFPAAVLIRALQPLEGIQRMQRNRRRPALRDLCRGPARLTQALGICGEHNGLNLYAPGGELWIENAPAVSQAELATGPRIGLGNTPEPWLSMPWRFYIAGSPFVSRP